METHIFNNICCKPISGKPCSKILKNVSKHLLNLLPDHIDKSETNLKICSSCYIRFAFENRKKNRKRKNKTAIAKKMESENAIEISNDMTMQTDISTEDLSEERIDHNDSSSESQDTRDIKENSSEPEAEIDEESSRKSTDEDMLNENSSSKIPDEVEEEIDVGVNQESLDTDPISSPITSPKG